MATDLRRVVTAMRMSSDLERMGDLARHVAEVARLRYPDSAIQPVMRSTVQQMGQVAERIVAKAGLVIAGKDVQTALALDRDDDEMDRLHRDIFTMLMDDKWTYGTEAAVDATLVGRYNERFADHAVSVARRVVYLVTGEFPSQTHQTTSRCEAAPRPWLATGWNRPPILGSAELRHRPTRVCATHPPHGTEQDLVVGVRLEAFDESVSVRFTGR